MARAPPGAPRPPVAPGRRGTRQRPRPARRVPPALSPGEPDRNPARKPPSATLQAFRAGAFAARHLPEPLVRAVAGGAAVAVARTPPVPGRIGRVARRRAMVARHLERVYGRRLGRLEKIRLVDEVFVSYARYWAESFRLPGLTAEEVAAGIHYDHFDRIEAGLEAGKGVILALPHLGGWEWAGTDLVVRGLKVNVVVEALEPPDLFEWFVSFREQLGMKVIPVGPGAASQCARALAANEVLCLLCDRTVAGTAGVEVEFFGERTELPGGPATLALRTGATLLTAGVYFDLGPRRHLGVVGPALDLARSGRLREDVSAGTRQVTAELEELIRRAPTQWHMLQPNWPSDPGWSRPARTAAPPA